MLLVTESALPSQVSARDVSDYPSYKISNISLDPDMADSNGCVVPHEPEKSAIAKARVFITENNGQETTSAQERELIEQSLARWCNTSRIKPYG